MRSTISSAARDGKGHAWRPHYSFGALCAVGWHGLCEDDGRRGKLFRVSSTKSKDVVLDLDVGLVLARFWTSERSES